MITKNYFLFKNIDLIRVFELFICMALCPSFPHNPSFLLSRFVKIKKITDFFLFELVIIDIVSAYLPPYQSANSSRGKTKINLRSRSCGDGVGGGENLRFTAVICLVLFNSSQSFLLTTIISKKNKKNREGVNTAYKQCWLMVSPPTNRFTVILVLRGSLR